MTSYGVVHVRMPTNLRTRSIANGKLLKMVTQIDGSFVAATAAAAAAAAAAPRRQLPPRRHRPAVEVVKKKLPFFRFARF